MKTTHQCPVMGCKEPKAQFHEVMCAKHFDMITPELQHRLWALREMGSVRAYLKARAEAIKAVNEKVKV